MVEKKKKSKKKFDSKTGLTAKKKKRMSRMSEAASRELYQAKMLRDMSSEQREEYLANVDKFPNARFGRWADGTPKGSFQQQLDHVSARDAMGDATSGDYVITHRRHVMEDDPALKRKSGGSVKGRPAKRSAEKS